MATGFIKVAADILGDFAAAGAAMWFGRKMATHSDGKSGAAKEQANRDLIDEQTFFKAMNGLRPQLGSGEFDTIFDFFEYLQNQKTALDFVRLRETLSLEPNNWAETLLEMLKTIGLIEDGVIEKLTKPEKRIQLVSEFGQPLPPSQPLKVEAAPSPEEREKLFKKAAHRLHIILQQRLSIVLNTPLRALRDQNRRVDESWADFWKEL